MVNSRLGLVKIVVIKETSSWESVPQSSGSQTEAVLVELTSHR